MLKQISATITILALASCTTTTGPVDTPGPVEMAPLVWKEGTTLPTRISDYRECQSQSVGGHPSMPEAQIAALAEVVDPATRERFLNRCLNIKGYTVTERRVCTRGEVENENFVRSSDIERSPPLSTIKCLYPAGGGFVTT